MSDEKPTINLTNSPVQAGIGGVGSNITISGDVSVTIGNLSAVVGGSALPEGDKAALQRLLAELEVALKAAPPETAADAAKVAKRAKEAVEEAAADQPEKDAIEAKTNLLKKAAENIAGAMPPVMQIAMNLIAHLLTLSK
jgi:hypothetical protein